jgi:hypothetical protein
MSEREKPTEGEGEDKFESGVGILELLEERLESFEEGFALVFKYTEARKWDVHGHRRKWRGPIRQISRRLLVGEVSQCHLKTKKEAPTGSIGENIFEILTGITGWKEESKPLAEVSGLYKGPSGLSAKRAIVDTYGVDVPCSKNRGGRRCLE